MIRIPITMCHGISEQGDHPLSQDHLDALVSIARQMGFESINYDQLAAWRDGQAELPARPIMFDFDHPARSMRHGVHEVLSHYGYAGNLFVNTGWMDPDNQGPGVDAMTWDEVRELRDLGWHMGAHTVTHPNLSQLFDEDPSGEQLRQEFEGCDATLERELGVRPRDLAYTGTSWSSAADRLARERYRFARLWITGAYYQADGKQVRYADLVGLDGDDEEDGGPPLPARYITCKTPAYLLPSMEIQTPLLHRREAFRAYLEGALAV